MEQHQKEINWYEISTDYHLPENSIIIVHLDGFEFSDLTKNLNKPFDNIFSLLMQQTMLELAKATKNCIFGYTTSDEIDLVIKNEKGKEQSFDNNIQDISSFTAGFASMIFQKILYSTIIDYRNILDRTVQELNEKYSSEDVSEEEKEDAYAKIAENNQRISVLEDMFSANSVFRSKCYPVQESDLWEIIRKMQKDGEDGLFMEYAKYNLPLDKINDKEINEIKKLLEDNGHDFEQEITSGQRNGYQCFKDETDSFKIIEAPIIEF